MFSNLDTGAGTNIFKSNGGHERGAHTGANSTYWAIRASAPPRLLREPTVGTHAPVSDCAFGPMMTFIGPWNESVVPGMCPEMRWRVDNSGGRPLLPPDIAGAMRERLRRHHSWHDD